MIIFYLTIPFMILALGVAVLPLTWALKHHENWDKSLVTVSDFEEKELELVAACYIDILSFLDAGEVSTEIRPRRPLLWGRLTRQ
jgi:hypothetical protein